MCAWVDSVHNGTAIMVSEGELGATDAISVLGSYGGGDGPPWGRTTFGRHLPTSS